MAITWAQRLKRVFKIDVEKCRVCGGSARVIACKSSRGRSTWTSKWRRVSGKIAFIQPILAS